MQEKREEQAIREREEQSKKEREAQADRKWMREKKRKSSDIPMAEAPLSIT